MIRVGTIVTRRDLAKARVLARSLHARHPEWQLHALVLDPRAPELEAHPEPFTAVDPAGIGCADLDALRGAYGPSELAAALAPWLVRSLLTDADPAAPAVLLDAGTAVLGPLTELAALLDQHAVVLLPRAVRPPARGPAAVGTPLPPDGVFDLGLVGVTAGPDGDRLLDAWTAHVLAPRGAVTSSAWADAAPGFVGDLGLLRDERYGLAAWNADARGLRTDGAALHVEAGDVRTADVASFAAAQTAIAAAPDLRTDAPARLLAGHRAQLQAAGGADAAALYPYDRLPSGLALDPVMRRLLQDDLAAGTAPRSVFEAPGEADLMASLAEPSASVPGLNRYLHALWSSRPDLQRAYPRIDGADLAGYLGWCTVHGRSEVPIPAAVLGDPALDDPAPGSGVAPAPASPSAGSSAGPPARRRPFGVNLFGYLRSELGIGEVARQLVGALDAAAVPVLPVALHAPDSRQEHPFGTVEPQDAGLAVTVVCVNADGLPALVAELGDGFLHDRYTVGMWWWETPTFPVEHTGSFALLDEVWVGSAFVADAVRAAATIPVVHLPVAVQVPDVPPPAVGEPGRPDAFTFLFSFDVSSAVARKNPLGLIEAYRATFAPDDGTALVLKLINAGYDPAGRDRIRAAAAGRPDIELIEGYLDPDDHARLVAGCDCYVSLHRAEGFGLTMAEAMARGKPVIATGWSGNLEYMTADNSFLVDHTIVSVGDGAAPYHPGDTWAEPDLAHAGRLMRQVFGDPVEAGRRGARAAQDIRTHHAPEVVGEAVRRRLERVGGRTPRRTAPVPAPVDLTSLMDRLAGRSPAAGRLGPVGQAARRAVLRATRPVTSAQDDVNAAVAGALVAARAQLEALEARTAAVEDRLACETADRLAAERARRP